MPPHTQCDCMKGTLDLKQEHGKIKLMLRILEKICKKLDSGEDIEPEHLDMAVDFIRGFADKCHHGKEEDVLFLIMKNARIRGAEDLIRVLIIEHNMGRDYVRAIAEAVNAYKSNDIEAPAKISQNAMKYVRLLDPHIDNENSTLFPMADSSLSDTQQAEMVDGFVRIETEVIGIDRHEGLQKTLDDLADRYMRG